MTPPTDVNAVARAFVRRFGTDAVDVDLDDDDASERLHETIPRGHRGQAEHTRWRSALEALQKKHHLSFEEFDAIESGANGEVVCSLEEGYLFGLAVGRQLRTDDAPGGDDEEALAALRAVVDTPGGSQ